MMRFHSPSIEIKSWRGPATVKMTIYELIKSDHEEILSLCKKILVEEDALSGESWSQFLELKKLVSLHTKAEEIVFYNTLHDRSIESQDDELRFDVMEGFEEHHMINLLLAEISMLKRDSDRWMAKMRVLSEMLEHHMAKEESSLFGSAQRDLESGEAQSLALEYLEEKDLVARGFT